MKVYTAFRHVFSVGDMAKRTSDKQSQKAFASMVYIVAKQASKQADKAKK